MKIGLRSVTLFVGLAFVACTRQQKNVTPLKGDFKVVTRYEKKVQVKFIIQSLEDGEYDTPRNVLYLSVNGQQSYLDTISACVEISRDKYKEFTIPKNALHACGGWWAGSGEYFYALRKKDSLIVFEGWQDEAQEDKGYHWSQWKSIPL